MGGGHHGPEIHGNPHNIKEEDHDISSKIRTIELIKHNPQVFHLNFYDWRNHWEVAGGAKTLLFALIGG